MQECQYRLRTSTLILVSVQTEDIKTNARMSVQTQDINTNTRVPAQTQNINTNARVSVQTQDNNTNASASSLTWQTPRLSQSSQEEAESPVAADASNGDILVLLGTQRTGQGVHGTGSQHSADILAASSPHGGQSRCQGSTGVGWRTRPAGSLQTWCLQHQQKHTHVYTHI